METEPLHRVCGQEQSPNRNYKMPASGTTPKLKV